MTALTNPEQIALFRLATLRMGIRLEMAGMKKSGRSCTAIARQMLGLGKTVKHAKVLEAIEEAIRNSKV